MIPRMKSFKKMHLQKTDSFKAILEIATPRSPLTPKKSNYYTRNYEFTSFSCSKLLWSLAKIIYQNF